MLRSRESLEAPDRSFKGHRDILTRNLARYDFVKDRVRGRTLDLGCGRGYGFNVIKDRADSLVGLDISEAFLADARKEYPEYEFIHGTGEQLPFADNSFDAVLSFEVIEHVENDIAFLQEIRRVAAPGAPIVISTPNKLIYSPNLDKPLNTFHIREYTPGRFAELMAQVFDTVEVFGQHERTRAEGAKDKTEDGGFMNRLVDKVPIKLKYLLPDQVQDHLSVMLRPPLKAEDCYFDQQLESAHTLMGCGINPA